MVRLSSGAAGLEPRTRGLRVDCSGATSALPARMACKHAPKAPKERGCDRRSFHEPFHDSLAGSGDLQSPNVSELNHPGVSGHGRKASGDSGLEALRVLKRWLSDVVYAALQTDLAAKHLEPTSNSATVAA
jgi:hypothetical protein